jgi:transcriptional regulator with XRE-family HTH domain
MTDDANLETGWYDADTATFGDRMAGAREASSISQEDLAKRLGVKTKTIRAWENDQSEPRANRLQMLAGMLSVSIMWLLSGRGDGIEAPDAVQPIGDDMAAILLELRSMRADQAKLADRAGRLEKRLRLTLAGGGA